MLEVPALVFWAVYPNRNYVRIEPADLEALAASFARAPFLRGHAEENVDSRDGTVVAAWVETRPHPSGMLAPALVARLRITTERGVRALADELLDRFSIGFDVRGWRCTVCRGDWRRCEHWPGHEYVVDDRRVLCELIAVAPRGREISVVNVPAVEGTGLLAALCAAKEAFLAEACEAGAGESIVGEDGAGGAGAEVPAGPAAGEESSERGEVVQMSEELEQRTEDGMEQEFEQAAAQAPQEERQVAAPVTEPAPVLAAADAAREHAEGAGQVQAHGDAAAVEPPADGLRAQLAQLQAQVQRQQEALTAQQERLAAQELEARIAGSGLSPASRQVLRVALATQGAGRPAGLDELIEALRQSEAEQAQAGVVRGLRALDIRAMKTAEERVQEAIDWAFGLQAAEAPPPSYRNVRDLYLAMTGDWEFYGRMVPERVELAATTTTLPGMAANALNKVVAMHYQNMTAWRWFEQIVDVVAHDGSTQDVQLIMVDGVANLSTVGEGQSYTELPVGDSRESMPFAKRGNYVGITLEMFRRSDIARMQAIPKVLMAASLRTRSAAIASLFTDNGGGGPILADDGKALFHADHGNVDTAAFSAAAWAAARKRVWSQPIPGTDKPLALWPSFCLVPIDLYDTALSVFGYGTGDVGKPTAAGTAQEPNPYGDGRPGDPRPVPVVVPDWSDTNDWACVVDPRLHPVICMAYANAPQGGRHALPEFYAGDTERSGLLFERDLLPVKVRDWWGYGVATYVGIAKNNVS